MSKKKIYLENAKRKTAVAKAALKQDGHGRITINHVPYEIIPEVMYREKLQELVTLIGTENLKDVDVEVNVVGGGRMGQISAARTAIARAFIDFRKNSAIRAKLVGYDRTLLSGDARHTEPKKYGGRSARSKKQKSYR
jgi:small subunit ribosomal protein S9